MCGRVAAICDVRHVVDYRIHHEVHAPGVESSTEVEQVLMRPKMRVEGVEVQWPVPMVGFAIGDLAMDILDDGRYHHSVKSHPLDVVQTINGSSPCSSAIKARGGIAWCC